MKYPDPKFWLTLSRDDVLDIFQRLTGSYSDGEGDKRFVYIQGTRKDKALLVSHADTAFDNYPIKVGFEKGIYFSQNRSFEVQETSQHNPNYTWTSHKQLGIGADDRAGCAILWALRDSGHSLLITSGEEKGCQASKWLIENDFWKNELNDHSFAVEFDRRGYKDAVFYDVGTNKFAEYVKTNTNYVPTNGGGTDIKALCKKICGVNLSVGFYSEHSGEEKLILSQWLNTLKITMDWLSKPLEKFELDPKDSFSIPYNNNFNHQYNNQNWTNQNNQNNNPNKFNGAETTTQKPVHQAPAWTQQGRYHVTCPFCKNDMIDRAWYINHFACLKCGRDI